MDVIFVYTGTQFWGYDNENDQVFRRDPEGHHYPRLISEGFPGVFSPIDTAFYDRRDGHIYFFKNTLVRIVSDFFNTLEVVEVHKKVGMGAEVKFGIVSATSRFTLVPPIFALGPPKFCPSLDRSSLQLLFPWVFL